MLILKKFGVLKKVLITGFAGNLKEALEHARS